MLEIRKLKEFDITQGFLELVSQFRPTNLNVSQAKDIFNDYRPQIYGGLLNNRVVGIATLILEHKFIHDGGIVGHIEDVIVYSEYRNQDIGSKLIKYVIAEAKRVGAYKVILDCDLDVSKFYEKLGFVKYNIGMRLDLC